MPLIRRIQLAALPEAQPSASPSRREEQEMTLPSSTEISTPAKTGEEPPWISTARRHFPLSPSGSSTSGIASRKAASTSSRPTSGGSAR